MPLPGNKVVVFSLQPWDSGLGSNCINIAREFSKENQVLYVNFPLDLNGFLRDRSVATLNRRKVIAGKSPELKKVEENIWTLDPKTVLLSINMLPEGVLYDSLLKRNNRLFAKRVLKACETLGFKEFTIFNDSDMFRAFYMSELLDPKAYLYYSRDNLMAVPYWQKHGIRAEAELIAKSTACFANSEFLHARLLKHNKNSHFIGQGCDLELWNVTNAGERPADMPANRPIIGYVGALVQQRLDIKLLEFIANEFPQCDLVLVGPEDEAFKQSNLHQLPNVIFCGNKAQEELPSYVAHLDVCINPQLFNEVTIGNYPRKIDEYLSMGKPVVATRTEGMNMFSDYVYLATDFQQWKDMVSLALSEGSEKGQERITFAGTHSWKNSVEKIYQALRY